MTEKRNQQGTQGTAQSIKGQVQQTSRLVTDVAGAVVGDRVKTEVGAKSSEMALETKAFAQAMREASSSLEGQGHDTQARLAKDIAGRADRLAAYLGKSDAQVLFADGKRLGRQASEFARREPLLVTAGAFTLGLLATRWLDGNDSSS